MGDFCGNYQFKNSIISNLITYILLPQVRNEREMEEEENEKTKKEKKTK